MKSLICVPLLALLTSCGLLNVQGKDLSVPVDEAVVLTDIARVAFLASDLDGNGRVEGNEWLIWSTTVFVELNKLYAVKPAEVSGT